MDNLENAKITKIATYNVDIRNLDGDYTKAYINMYEIESDGIFEYWYCVQNRETLHFAIDGVNPIHDKTLLSSYIEKDLIEMDL